MRAKLTARTIAALKPAATPYEVCDTELKGVRLRVQSSGVMTYCFAYQTETGKRSRYRTGKAGTLSPAQARDIAAQKAADMAKGSIRYLSTAEEIALRHALDAREAELREAMAA